MSGRMNDLVDRLLGMLRDSVAWQIWCGGSTQAAESLFDTVAPVSPPFPHAIVDLGENQDRIRDDIEMRGFQIQGDLVVVFFDRAPMTSEGARSFRDRIDAVLADLETASNDGRNLMIRRISLTGGPQFVEGKDRGSKDDEIEVRFNLEFREWP